MAVHRLLKGCSRSWPISIHTLRCTVYTKAAETIEELENVYNERKCFINGKLPVHTCGRLLVGFKTLQNHVISLSS